MLALDNEKSFGKRINVFEQVYWMQEINEVLHDEFQIYSRSISESVIGSFPVFLLSLFDKPSGTQLIGYGKKLNVCKKRFSKIFKKFSFRQIDESLVEMVYDMKDKGLVRYCSFNP